MSPYDELLPYLRFDERLIWAGRPDPSVRFAPSDAYLVPFSLVWGGFMISMELAATASGDVIPMLLGIPFISLGVYMLFGRFVYKAWRKRRTVYGVTDRRAIVVSGATLVDSPLRYVSTQVRRSRDRRRASVVFGDMSGRRGMAAYLNTGMELLTRSEGVPVAFFDVVDPQPMLAAIDQGRA